MMLLTTYATFNKAFLALVLLFALLIATFVTSSLRAQDEQGRREFGYSLKRWERNEKEQKAVQAKKGDKMDPMAVIRMETSLAVINILVFDNEGRSVLGLKKEDFVIAEDNSLQEVASLSLGDGATVPRSIVLIIDYSGSQLPFIENSVVAAKALIDKLKPNDRMAIVTDDVSLLTGFTGDKWKLKGALDLLLMQAKSGHSGRSEQYSALLATLKELTGGVEFPVIIFQTDGDELEMLRNAGTQPPLVSNSSRFPGRFKEYSIEDIYTIAEKARTTVYAVIPGVKFVGIPFEERVERTRTLFEKQFKARTGGGWRPQAPAFEFSLQKRAQTLLSQQQALDQVAKLTGGWSEFLEEPEQAAGIYDRIFTGIEHRYLLTYYPTNIKRDGKLRQVNVKVRHHPEYVIWGKKSYYAGSQ